MEPFSTSLCVFCGSSRGIRPSYMEAATQVGRQMAESGLGVVYGGAKIGLMGAVADGALAAHGQVIGVIPDAIVRHEVAHSELTELHIVRSMHERKAKMADLSQGFIVLPGGLGTLEELFEVLTWNQLGIQSKPCGFLNLEGYFDPMFEFLDRVAEEGFVTVDQLDAMIVESTVEDLIERMIRVMELIQAPARYDKRIR